MENELKWSPSMLRRQRLIRIFAYLCMAGIIISILPDLYFGLWYSAVTTLAGMVFFVLVITINRFDVPLAANILIFSLVILVFYFAYALGRVANVQMLLLVIILGIPFIIETHKKRLILFHLIHPILVLIFLELTNYKISFIRPFEGITDAQIGFFGSINLLIIFLFIPLVSLVILTANQKSEAEIKEINYKLEQQNVELTKKNEELDQFAYRVSHDLRSPIASMKGLMNILQEETDLMEIQKYHTLINKSLFRLDDFIKEILDHSQNIRTDLKISQLDLSQQIQEIYDQLQYTATDSRVQLKIDIQQNAQVFCSDAYRLKIIFHNLISNSLRYYDPHKEDNWIEIIGSIDSQKALIQVLDNGLGIGETHLKRVFEMFYRANLGMTGSGLGLYIVKECMEKLSGKIELQSEIGKGCKFILQIPNSVY